MTEGQLLRIKRQFIQSKTKKLKKDQKYGFKLSELDQKIKRQDLADKVQMLKQKLLAEKGKSVAQVEAANETMRQDDGQQEEHKCQFCMNHKLQDYRIPQAKMNQLFYNDFIKCKYEAQIRAMK